MKNKKSKYAVFLNSLFEPVNAFDYLYEHPIPSKIKNKKKISK